MGDHHHQPSSTSPDFHNILGIAKSASIKDVCKAYKSLVMRWHPDKNPSSNKIEAEAKFKTINEAYEALKDKKQSEGRKRNDDPYSYYTDNEGSRRSEPTTPKTPYKHRSVDASFLSKSSSRRSTTPCQRSSTRTPSPGGSLGKSASRRSTTPIMFSYSTVRRKLPPVEKNLECTLEELCHGCVKKIKVTRDVLTDRGVIVQEEELLAINVKPGWKKGTKITFEGMGDEKPGSYPADIIFSIDEKRHPLFKRDGDDLVLAIEIPLLKALTGCSFSIPLLGGDKMSLSFDDVIYPGYEKIIPGQGMPIAKEQQKRGDLRIKFRIIFPSKLSSEQRSDIRNLLNDSS